jgi:hypothetical protein
LRSEFESRAAHLKGGGRGALEERFYALRVLRCEDRFQ